MFWKDDKVPNEEAVAMAPTVGWLLLAAVLSIFVLLIVNSERWRRWWLTVEDPRSIGIYRIVFGFFVICNMNDFYEYWTFLFTDEGIFTADVARQVHASAQFEGFGDGLTEDSPWGFFDLHAVWTFLKGPKYSLLYFWDSPKAFWIHMGAFQLCAVLFMIGFRTRLMGVLTFFLMNSIFFRNHLFWEGTELVYRVYLAYLLCAKSGHAYSVDNWLRCRKLRKKKLLSEPGGPGDGAGLAPDDDHPKGLQAIYRLIPAWPRRLAIVQLGATYACTGILKNGSVWAKGDAVYYAWNMDHFYRFYPQQLSAWFGTNFLRIASWQAHWGESLFIISVLGVLAHWSASETFRPNRGLRAVVTNVCWASIIGLCAAVLWVTWPVHFTPNVPRWAFVTGFVLVLGGFWAGWRFLGKRPLQVRGRIGLWLVWGGVIALVNLLLWLLLFPLLNNRQQMMVPIILNKVGIMAGWTAIAIGVPLLVGKFLPGVVTKVRGLPGVRHFITDDFLDNKHEVGRQWVASWILGRRIWLTWHISLMGGIFTLMNIGQFQTGMLSQTFVFIYGAEVAIGLHAIARWRGWTSRSKPVPAEDPTLPHLRRDAARMPQSAMLIALGIFLIGVLVRVKFQPEWDWRWIWLGGLAFMAGVGVWVYVSSRGKRLPTPTKAGEHYGVYAPEGNGLQSDGAYPKMPWAYGPFGRFVISCLLTWHITGVTVWLTPDKYCLRTWRGDARKVWLKWLTVTQTDQGWGMFAPNPPRSNVFLKVLVTDADGEVFDLKTDVYAPERKPIPWIWNDRMRKMNRRIIGGESGNSQWYRKWYTRHICRQWALEHEGNAPKKVELIKMWYRMPSPEETLRKGWYIPEKLLADAGAEKLEHTEVCKRTVMGQLRDEVRERHGLPPLPDGWKYKPWLKHKKKKWEKKRAKELGLEPPEPEKKKKKKQTTARADVKKKD